MHYRLARRQDREQTRQDLQSMIGDIGFPNSKSMNLQVRLYGDTGIVVGAGIIKAHKGESRSSRRKIRLDRHICEKGWRMEGYSFADHSSIGKIIADVYP